jgi:hypothetical protein
MSAEDTDRRANSAPLVLLWIAIALAPVAGTLLVLGGEGGLLRAGGALAMLAVVLVALGSVLARAGTGPRAGGDVEAYLGHEIEALRADTRADISRATKTSHRVLAEQIAALGDTVEALRGQIEVLRSHVERNHLAAPAPVAAGHNQVSGVAGVPGGVFRHTETVQVTRQTTMLDADSGYGDRTGSVYGSAAGGVTSGAVPGQRRSEYDAYKGRDEYTDSDGYAGSGRRARPDGEPTGGWSPSREVHVGERSSEIRIDDTAAQMRTQDRWASMVQRDGEPARRSAETTGGRRRRDDDDDHARYWSNFHAETTQERGSEPGRRSEPGWGVDRGGAEPAWASGSGRIAEPARPALPAGAGGEPVPAWAGGWATRTEERAGEPVRAPAESARHRGTEYGGGAEPSLARGAGTQYGSRHGGTDYAGGVGGTGYGRAGGADLERTGGGYGGTEYGRAGGTAYGGRAGGTEYGRAGGAEYGGTQYGGTQYGGTQYGRPAGGTEYGDGYERTGGGHGATEYGSSGRHDAGYTNGYQDDGRRPRHGDWR